MTLRRTEVPGIYKEKDGVLINRDIDSLQAYKLRKEKDRKLSHVQEDIESLKSDIHEIKQMIKGLIR